MRVKSILAALLLMVAGLQTVWAQKMVIYKSDKTTIELGTLEVDSIVFVEDEPIIVDNHEWVDLGLPSGTLWATCNVGANSPEEYGDYFAWGETEPKNVYNWNTYKYCKGSSDTMTKYCTNSDYGYNGFTDNITDLLPEDDAATVNWGSDWQIPTMEQYQELRWNSTTEWITENGIFGCKITSNSNGNSIFLPGAGYRNDKGLNEANKYGNYWLRSLDTFDSYHARAADFFSYYHYIGWGYCERYWGNSIRPVRPVQLVTSIVLSETSISLQVDETKTITATVLPENASNQSVTWNSGKASVATVDQTGKMTAVGIGTCTITCSAKDGSGVTAECQVTVGTQEPNTHDWVDLGLPSGTLWATCNVGANSPEEYGDFFAWGETEPKERYDLDTYKYGNLSGMTKYCATDNKTELEPEDDAATANWGSDWQMPSITQIRELINSSNTTTIWTTLNGVYGRKITSNRNGNYIFLPAAGHDDYRVGDAGYYWSRLLAWDRDDSGRYLYFDSNEINYNSNMRMSRSTGLSVRPVRVQ